MYAAEAGGLDPIAAEVVQVAVESLYERLGIVKSGIPGLESFGSTARKADATRIALEDMKENIKKAWASIVAIIEKAIAWVKDFFAKIFVATERLKARATKIAAAAKGAKGTLKDGAKIESGRLYNALSLGGTVDAGKVQEGAANLAAVTKDVLATQAGNTAGLVKDAAAALAKSDNKNFVTDFKFPAMDAAGLTKVADSAGFAKAPEGLSVYRSAEMLGNRAVVAYTSETALTGAEGIKQLANLSAGVAKFDPKAKEADKKELPILTPDQAGKLAGTVLDIVKNLEAFKANREKLASAKADLLKASKAAGSKNKDLGADVAKAMVTVARTTAKLADQPYVSLNGYAVNTSKSLLDLAELSLKQYGKGEAAKEEKKD